MKTRVISGITILLVVTLVYILLPGKKTSEPGQESISSETDRIFSVTELSKSELTEAKTAPETGDIKSWNPPITADKTPTDRMDPSTNTNEQDTDFPVQQLALSTKARHVAFLKTGKILDEVIYQDDEGRDVKATMVEKFSDIGNYFVIRETKARDSSKLVTTYVEIANHLIVRFNKALSNGDLTQFKKDYDLSGAKKMLLANTYKFEFDKIQVNKVPNLKESLKADSRVKYSDTNYISYTTATPNDPMFNQLWGLENNGTNPDAQVPINFVADIDSQATIAWDSQTDCSTHPVAVLDTGIDPNHPDLAENILPNSGRDFVSNDPNDFIDRNGHGTHVSGTIGAVGNNAQGIAGVCWKAAIIPVKVLGDDGAGALAGIIDGLMYVSTTTAKVINMSLGGGGFVQAYEDAVAVNTTNGRLLVAAAGNENNNNDVNPAYPATFNDPGIISVAAHHGGGDITGFSNFGATSVDIAAPGQTVYSTIPGGNFAFLDGTSMASPHVAGAVALFWAYAPELTPAQVKAELLDSAIQMPFTKDLVGGKMMSIDRLMQAVIAQASFGAATTLSSTTSNVVGLTLQTKEDYSSITRIEAYAGGQLIGESTSAQNLRVTIPVNLKETEIILVVTDSNGRQFTSDPQVVQIDLEKRIGFDKIDELALSGSSECSLSKVVEGSEEVLYTANVGSKRECQKLCDIVGPMVFSSQGEIVCAQNNTVIYQAQR